MSNMANFKRPDPYVVVVVLCCCVMSDRLGANGANQPAPVGETPMSEGDAGWSRSHVSGMVAIVFQWGGGKFSAGAVPKNGMKGIRSNVGGPLERVRAIADAESGRPQPCACPPWEI